MASSHSLTRRAMPCSASQRPSFCLAEKYAVVIVGVRDTRQSRSWRAEANSILSNRTAAGSAAKRVCGAILALVALWVRLVWPAPPTIAQSDITALVGLGEHALCLAAASPNSDPIRSDDAPAPAGDRADHDHSLCCLWHAVGGFVLPQVAAVVRIAFTEEARPGATTLRFQPANLIGAARARGPPGLA